ncbi:MAG: diguanylate cyclase [Magnetococcales bacterium]|nr:diguanylate cyclase [Magnetococcales bacterium]
MSPCLPSDLPRLLIIDDDVAAIQLLQNILKGQGQAFFATNGADGLLRAQENLPDLILLDADMPDMSGFDVCAALKADVRMAAVPIIFVTSYSDIENETRALQLGAVDFISKPFSPPVVKARVHNHLLLKQHIDSLHRRATTDGLTGIANRRSFDETLDVEWRRAARRQEPLALLMLDVDHFKRFNDHYGHPVGDDCLRAVAQVLATAAQRSGDLAARYGGEEFAFLLPNTGREAAMGIAKALCARVMALRIPHCQSDVANQVTVSIGVFSLVVPCANQPDPPPSCPDLEHRFTCKNGPATLVKAADQGLYLAKTSGRNRAAFGSMVCAC